MPAAAVEDGPFRPELTEQKPRRRFHLDETVERWLSGLVQGNVNCEVGPDGRRGGVAGLHDFAVAAASRPEALSIVALAAAGKGGRSRIVNELTGGTCSLPPASVDVVVTEYGSADLRRLTPADRADANSRTSS